MKLTDHPARNAARNGCGDVSEDSKIEGMNRSCANVTIWEAQHAKLNGMNGRLADERGVLLEAKLVGMNDVGPSVNTKDVNCNRNSPEMPK